MIDRNHPAIEEVRRHWGLSVDIHRRPERLAEFDRMICSLMAEAWEACRRSIQHDPDALDVLPNPYRT